MSCMMFCLHTVVCQADTQLKTLQVDAVEMGSGSADICGLVSVTCCAQAIPAKTATCATTGSYKSTRSHGTRKVCPSLRMCVNWDSVSCLLVNSKLSVNKGRLLVSKKSSELASLVHNTKTFGKVLPDSD